MGEQAELAKEGDERRNMFGEEDNNKMSEKLKPCPFQPCEGDGQIKELGFYIAVKCNKCGAQGPAINTDISDFVYENEDPKQEAIKAWDRKAK